MHTLSIFNHIPEHYELFSTPVPLALSRLFLSLLLFSVSLVNTSVERHRPAAAAAASKIGAGV